MRVAELAVRFGCEIVGDPETRVTAVATLEKAGELDISFLANAKYRSLLKTSRAGAVILSAADAPDCATTALVHKNPYEIYARVAAMLHPQPKMRAGIDAMASVSAQATISQSASIAAAVVIADGVQIGERCVIGPGCVIGRDVHIEDDTRLVANVTLCHGVSIGKRCVLHPGAVIGADGFGIANTDDGWIKVPQLGGVRIGDDVEIGASTTIDRGAIDDTVVGNGVKLDNQIQVAHNVHIGDHTVIAACTGISGSTRIGKRCMIGGAVGFVGHLDICDDVVVTGQTMVNRSITVPGMYSSALPMDEARRWRRNSARFRKLDELAKRLGQLEKDLKANR
ncbi:MAG: UDP-3-O-(3-hydroxymyristoyl)glucosamine N-acyltransferase [Gammaproteobacteria bacterium]|nr:UDP-3-O-(3-hydroxymyristoyl)glucosamine N-acyltransferase [Gammaproteobacteria bacterium]